MSWMQGRYLFDINHRSRQDSRVTGRAVGSPVRRELLKRIQTTCRRSFPEARWRTKCHEWQALSERLQAPTGNPSPAPGG